MCEGGAGMRRMEGEWLSVRVGVEMGRMEG